jgi:RNA polymerase sigma factor (sigma-70 family)
VNGGAGTIERLLRELAPQALAAVARRSGDFAAAEDAVQEALLAAATRWPGDGTPDNPLGWLIRVAARRLTDQYRSEDARRRREALAASWSLHAPAGPVPGEEDTARDDTLILMFMCCHPSLTPGAAIPLTLRAVGGLTTREIAAAFLVPEPTMAQRISRAKSTLKASGEPFTLPPTDRRAARLRSVLHVLYLLFNEGYASSGGPELARSDLSGEAIRLARGLHASLPGDPETTGLLALMLLTDARCPARTGPGGELIPLAEQQRSRWDRACITEGMRLITAALQQGQLGEYQLQAAIAAVHDEAPSHAATDWPKILALYGLLERRTGNPMVTLNRAVAVAMMEGPAAGLALLDGVRGPLGGHHRFHAVRGHLLEMAGDLPGAAAEFRTAAAGTANLRERHYLTLKAASLAASPAAGAG